MAGSFLSRIRDAAASHEGAGAALSPFGGSEQAASDRALRARALGWLFVAGATIGVVSVLLPHPAASNDGGLWTNIALAAAGGLILLWLGPHCRSWMIHAALVAGALLITRAILLGHEPVSFYTVWYIWIGLYAFYFFRRGLAIAHLAFVGVLYAYTLHHSHADSAVARWLTTMATVGVASVFIDTLARRARGQTSAAETSANMMAAVAAIAHRLAGLEDSEEARATLCEAVATSTGAAGVALWERSEDAAAVLVTADWGWAPDRREIPLSVATAGVVRALTTVRPVTAVAADGAEPAAEFDSSDRPAGLRWQPIVYDGRSIAVLALCWHDPAPASSPVTITLAGLLAAEAATTLERVGLVVRLESLARTDELTGLPNRRAWQEQLPRELERATRTGEAVCVAMLDLDHFKRYNDDAGHLAGDVLLTEVAGAWRGQLRPTDLLARYGGEEFAVALPGCAAPNALEVIERVRRATPSGQACSGGIAQWNGSESVAELLERADRALYQAKQSGRNQIKLASHSDA
jgi:diguanylate cyclase (GGDEF)-like protein